MFRNSKISAVEDPIEAAANDMLAEEGGFQKGDFTVCKLRSPNLRDRFGPGPYVAEIIRPKIVTTMLVRIRGEMLTVPLDCCKGRYPSHGAAKAQIG